MTGLVPPPVIDSARIVAYAHVPADIPFNDTSPLFVDGEPLGRVPALAIGIGLGDDADVLLCFCNTDWACIGASGAASIEAAQAFAERSYPGLAEHWKLTGTTREDALDYYDQKSDAQACSFCRRRRFEMPAAVVVTGPSGAAICSRCVAQFRLDLAAVSDDGAAN